MTFFNGQGYLDFGAPAQRHSEPSISAAIGQTRAKRDTDRQRILDALERLGPLTDEQIGKAAGIGMNTVRPRRVELVATAWWSPWITRGGRTAGARRRGGGGCEMRPSWKNLEVLFLPWSSDAPLLWAVSICDGRDLSLVTAYQCHGRLTDNRGNLAYVIHQEDAPWELRLIGSRSADFDCRWIVVAASDAGEAMACDDVCRVRNEVSRSLSRRSIAPSKRYAILARDKFRCRYCGAVARDGLTLHVDHIVPVSSGGTDDDSNLCCACSECNLGKSNRFSDAPPA